MSQVPLLSRVLSSSRWDDVIQLMSNLDVNYEYPVSQVESGRRAAFRHLPGFIFRYVCVYRSNDKIRPTRNGARKQAYTDASLCILYTHLFLSSPHGDVSSIKVIQLLSIPEPDCKLPRSSSHFLECQVGHCDSSLSFPRAPEGVFRTFIYSDCRRLLCICVLRRCSVDSMSRLFCRLV